MEIVKMDIFDLVDSPRLAKMVWHVQRVLPEVPIEKLSISHFPIDVVEPIFMPSKKNLDYMKRFALAIMITHIETTQKEMPAFCLSLDDVDEIFYGMVKEGAHFLADALDLPDSFLPKGCENALSKALVKWSKQSNPLCKENCQPPGAVRDEAELFLRNCLEAVKDHVHKDLSDIEKKRFQKIMDRMMH